MIRQVDRFGYVKFLRETLSMEWFRRAQGVGGVHAVGKLRVSGQGKPL